VRSYRTFSPLPKHIKSLGGTFSVALSVDFHPPLLNNFSKTKLFLRGILPAWSPDFPPNSYHLKDRAIASHA